MVQIEEIINYKVSRQLKEALVQLNEIVKKKEYQVIESQDILLAIASTLDAGAAYALGRSSITKSKISKEIKSAKHVKTREVFEPKEDDDNLRFGSSYRVKEEKLNHIKSNPVQFLQETPIDIKLKYTEEFSISEHVKDALDFAEEIRQQIEPNGLIDTYWLLIAFVQDELSNAYQVINKQMLLFDYIYNGEDLHDRFTTRMNIYREFRDGKAAREEEEKARKANMFSSKLENPDYSILEDIATDITKRAKSGELMPVVGRDIEIKKIEVALTRRDKNNVALIGPGGVGKSAIVDGLALKIANDEISSLKGKRILQFSLNTLFSVISSHYEQGVLRFIEEMKREKDIILFIDEIHMLGKVKSLTDALKPLMARGDFRIIGATTPMEWMMSIENDAALVRRFEKIVVDEPSIEDAMTIVKTVAPVYEKFHQVNYLSEAIELAVRLSKKYLEAEKLPDAAFTILDNAAALVRIEAKQEVELVSGYQEELMNLREKLIAAQAIEFNEAEIEEIRHEIDLLQVEFQKERNVLDPNVYALKVTVQDIKNAIEQKTGTTVQDYDLYYGEAGKIAEDKRLAKLKETLYKKVIGQKEAIDVISDAVIRSKKGFRNPKRPIGVYLFLGTTGVGKTETAKVLAEELYGSKNDLIRFDMSEYQQPHEVAKLIGAPPGYVGYGAGGQLTSAIQKNPTSVILFDEIEKANEKIYDVLLQVFDDGRLTDSMGVTVDFTKTIIIMTSNLGASSIRKDKIVGFTRIENPELNAELVRQKTREAMNDFFRPELLNRIDEVVTFEPFDQAEINEITRLLINEEIKIIEEEGYRIEFSDQAINLIAGLCYDPENGARPIRRGISKLIETPLANMLVRRELEKNDVISVGAKDGELEFQINI
ncbi:ATP-dependent Clp protease ATP-binding subunit [Streptococcus hyovaginalis]|uniref:ATP-dependent Clp protease ATP-binding subunit n=2 Tax=Streptococcus hyovaginalis TaxID=149015 RepID=UPI002A840210|nr:ATP-dependent Clp protease ATP-binding subunit [Streptococcus hyovaginalis]MDY4511541.1 ATP-dependent Clp protease ATP-binding subunit [Streptococcus hyovaginalis]